MTTHVELTTLPSRNDDNNNDDNNKLDAPKANNWNVESSCDPTFSSDFSSSEAFSLSRSLSFSQNGSSSSSSSDDTLVLEQPQEQDQIASFNNKTSCKHFYKGEWSLATFFEFYDRVLGSKIMDYFGVVVAQRVTSFLESRCLEEEELQQETKKEPFHVLEVAAGTGRFTKHLYSHLAASTIGNFRLTATDMSAAAIVEAQRVLPDEVTKNTTLLGDVDMVDMPEIADHSVDVLVCGFGIMFPPDKLAIVREFQRVLKPTTGRVVATMFQQNVWLQDARDECLRQFGVEPPILRSALELDDPTYVKELFQEQAHMQPQLYQAEYQFQANRLETEELLYNSCILLEEFNQESHERQAAMLETITETIHKRAAVEKGNRHNDDDNNNNDNNKAEFPVKVWILECTQPRDLSVIPTCSIPDRTGLDLTVFRAFVDSTLATRNNQCAAAKQEFLEQHGTAYDDAAATAFRAREFARLDKDKEIYLDYVGGSLAPLTVLQNSFAAYQTGAAGNPHSAGKKSKESFQKLRQRVLQFFNCHNDDNDNDDDDGYEMILTANASSAITLVAECFPFTQDSLFVLSKDNHTSVHNIRHSVAEKGGTTRYVTLTPDLTLWEPSMQRALCQAQANQPNLLAYPAQSNATGIQHDLKWVAQAQAKGFRVLLDAAAYIPTTPLDLSRSATCRPDFIPMSFYKIFGYPTGLGCLLAKKSALAELHPYGMRSGSVCYFSGPWSPTQNRILWHDEYSQKFEHGTPNYMAFESTRLGLDFVLNSQNKIEVIGQRAKALARWLENKLKALRHSNGHRLVRIYESTTSTLTKKGATIMCNFWDLHQSKFPHAQINAVAAREGISVRSGCFCNLGVVQQATYEGAGAEHCELDRKGDKITTCTQFQAAVLTPGHCGAIRISFGMGSTFHDAYAFYLFAQALRNTTRADLKYETTRQ